VPDTGRINDLTVEVDADTAGANAKIKEVDKHLDYTARDRTSTVHVKIDKDSDLGHAVKEMGGLNAKLLNASAGIKVMGAAFTAIKIPVIINGISLAAQGISTLAGGTYALGAALAPVGGLLGALPGGFLAVGTAAGTLISAFKGVGDAVKATNAAQLDYSRNAQDKMATALAKLTPAAQQFVTQGMKPLKAELTGLKAVAQEPIFQALNDSLGKSGPLFSTVRGGLASMASAVGDFIKKLSTEISTPTFLKDLGSVMQANAGSFSKVGDGIIKLVKGFMDLMVVARPLVDYVANLFDTVSAGFADWASKGRETGNLAEFFDRVMITTDKVIAIFGDLWGILKNLGAASRDLGDWLLDSLGEGAENMKNLTGSAEGMTKIKGYFDSLKGPLHETSLLLQEVAKVFFNVGTNSNLEDVIRQLREEAIPVLQRFNDTTSAVFTEKFITAATKLANAFMTLSSEAGALVFVATAVESLASAFDWLMSNIPGFSKFIEMLIIMKATILTMKLAGFKTMLAGIGSVFAGVGSAMMAAVVQAVQVDVAFQNVAKQGKFGTGSLKTFRTELDKIGKGAAVGAAVASLAALFVTVKQKIDENKKASAEFKKSLEEAFDTKFKTGNLDAVKAEILNVQQQIDGLADKFDNKKTSPGLIAVITGSHKEDEKNYNEMKRQNEERQAQVDMAESLAKATGISSTTTAEYTHHLQEMGGAAKVATGNVADMKRWLDETADAQRRASRIDSWNGELGLELNEVDAQEFFSDGLLDTLDRAKETARQYTEALAATKALEAELASAQSARESAQKALTQAVKAETNARKQLMKAEEALAEARKGASALDWAEQNLSHKRALIEQQRATEDLNLLYGELAKGASEAAKEIREISLVSDEFTGKVYEVIRITSGEDTGGQTALERARQLEDARMRQEAANIAVARSEEAIQELSIKGTDLDEAVVSAREAVATAQEQVAEASEGARVAAKNLYDADMEVKRISGELALAQFTLAVATRDAETAQVNAYNAIADAGEKMGIRVKGALELVNSMIEPGSPLSNNLIGRLWQIAGITGASFMPTSQDIQGTGPNYFGVPASGVTSLGAGGGGAEGAFVYGGHKSAINEEGVPEILSTGGHDYLTMPFGQNGKVTPLDKWGDGGGKNANITMNVSKDQDPMIFAHELAWQLA
jgi:hypothetical protein